MARVLCAKNTLTFRVRSTRGSRSNGGAKANGYDIKWKAKCDSSDQTLRSIRRRNPPCNAEDYQRAGHIVIEAWFGGY